MDRIFTSATPLSIPIVLLWLVSFFTLPLFCFFLHRFKTLVVELSSVDSEKQDQLLDCTLIY
ncbi:hypothetical protein Lalb_Chr08g0238291 [Lupinus albus]|uniref:Uncharacterized protein n=1 Tax=Lupinus albus TaxID=3870 RepID=A0A6A4Q5F5_LUPAL|nr:hypothetical protein Lalb_Chr08g0238291 [Lupinus albus]